MMGLPSNRSRQHRRLIEKQVYAAKKAALIETFAKDDSELRARMEAMSYPEIVAAKNAGHLTHPELPIGVGHGTVPSSLWVRGVWPRCKCGLDPHDNTALALHYAEHGFREVDRHGTIHRYPLDRSGAGGVE